MTRYQAALIIYRLLQQIEEELKAKGESPTMEAMSSEDLEALKNAIQELAAELAALGVRVSALEDSAATKDDIARLEAMIEELKAQPMPEVELGMDQAALQDLMDRVEAASIAADTALAQAQQLAEQLDALAQDVEGVKGDVAALSTQVEANAQAIQALNELAVLLNQDVLSLQDRVTALEKGLAEQGEGPAINLDDLASKEDVAAVQEFAAALRSDLVTLSEKVSKLEGTVTDLSGKVSTLQRNAFTISGSLTLTYTSKDANNFNSYDVDRVIGGTFVSTGDVNGNGQVVDDADPITPLSGSTTASLSLKIQTGALDAKSSGGANAYPGLVQFSITGSWTNADPGSSTAANLVVDKVSSTLKVADGQQLSFVFGRSLNTKFTEYVMDNEDNSLGHGVVATLKGLPLGGTLTAVYGEKDPTTADYDYVKGLRLAFQPGQNLGFGLSYAQHDASFAEVAGVDATADLGIAKVSGEYFRFGTNIMSAYSEGGYVRVEVPQLLGLKANFRALDAGAANPAGLSLDTDNPFRDNQRGFTVEASLPIAIVNLGLLYNAQVPPTFVPSASAFRATLGLALPAGFSLSLEATLASATAGEWFPATYADGVSGPASLTEYNTAITATLKHDGKAENALVKGLNLTLAYTNNSLLQPAQSDSLAFYGDYGGLALGPLSVDKVIFRYSDSDLQNAYRGPDPEGAASGLGINLAGLPLNPSLTGEFAARVSDGGKSETKYGFGVKFGQFLFDKSVLEVKAAEYSVRGLSITPTANDADKAFDPTADMLYSDTAAVGAEATLSGVYVTWTYWDLSFAWAFFKKASLFSTTWTDYGRAFQISYKVTF